MAQRRSTYEELRTPRHTTTSSSTSSLVVDNQRPPANTSQGVQQSKTLSISPLSSPDSASKLLPAVENVTRHSLVFGFPFSSSSHHVGIKEEEVEITLPELAMSTRVSQLSDLSQPSEAFNLEAALASRHHIGRFEGLPKHVLADSLRRELDLDTLAVKKDNGFVLCAECDKKVFSPKGLKEWRAHCKTQHGRSKDVQFRLVSEARSAAQHAAAVANTDADHGTPPAPGSRFVSGRFEGATRTVQKEATRLEIELDPLSKRILNDSDALACKSCGKRIAISRGLRDWRTHCRQVHMRTTKQQSRIIEKARADAQRSTLGLVRRATSSSSFEDSSLTELDDDEDVASATSDPDEPSAVGSRFTVGHFRGVTNAIRTAAVRLECEFDPLVESFDDASITCGECKRTIKGPVKQWRMHCRAVHRRSTRTQIELVEHARATTLQDAGIWLENLRSSGDAIRPSTKIQPGARVPTENQNGPADGDSLPAPGSRFTIGTFTEAPNAVRKHACHLECEYDPLVASFDDNSVTCADCKRTVRGPVREWRQHCRTAHQRTTQLQTALVLRARAAALQSAGIDPGSTEEASNAPKSDLDGQPDSLNQAVEGDSNFVMMTRRRIEGRELVEEVNNNLSEKELYCEEVRLDPLAGSFADRLVECVECKKKIKLRPTGSLDIAPWRIHCASGIHRRTHAETQRLINTARANVAAAQAQHPSSHRWSAYSKGLTQMEDAATRDSSPLTQLSTSSKDVPANAVQSSSGTSLAEEEREMRPIGHKRAAKRRAQYDSDDDLLVSKRARVVGPPDSAC